MRQVDRRTRVSRRVFLRGSATAVPAAAVAAAGVSIGPEAAWEQTAKNLKPHTSKLTPQNSKHKNKRQLSSLNEARRPSV